jgi:HK97 family phage major capsid protein
VTLLEKLYQRLSELSTEMRGLLMAADDASRDLNEEENKRWQAIKAEAKQVKQRIEQEEETADLEARANRPTADPPPPDPSFAGGTPGSPGRAPAVHTPENRPYSLLHLFRGLASKDMRQCGVEVRASDMIAERIGRTPDGCFVPYRSLLPLDKEAEAIRREIERRDITKATTGAELVGTDLVPSEFIELLRAESVIVALGARTVPNLVGDVDIGRQTAPATAVWMAAETTDAAGDAAFNTDSVSLSPKTVAIKVEVSRRMLKQSTPGIEEIVRDDIRQQIGLAVDAGGINGTGASGQPQGIVGATGVGGVTTAGAVSWANMVEFETDLGTANALRGRLAYATRAGIAGTLKTTLKDSGVGGYILEGGTCNGYPLKVSEQIPASTIIFGNWAELIIGMWGVLDMFGDPYTLGDRGGLVVRGFQDIDIGLRHGASFSVATDA